MSNLIRKPEIKLFTTNDLSIYSESIRKLLEENYKINFSNYSGFAKYVETNLIDMHNYIIDGSAYVFGIINENNVIGFLWAYKRTFLNEDRLHIIHIIIDSEYRNIGLGTLLIDYIENLAVEENIKIIELITSSDNTNTINFYKTHGFKIKRYQFEKNIGDKNGNH